MARRCGKRSYQYIQPLTPLGVELAWLPKTDTLNSIQTFIDAGLHINPFQGHLPFRWKARRSSSSHYQHKNYPQHQWLNQACRELTSPALAPSSTYLNSRLSTSSEIEWDVNYLYPTAGPLSPRRLLRTGRRTGAIQNLPYLTKYGFTRPRSAGCCASALNGQNRAI